MSETDTWRRARPRRRRSATLGACAVAVAAWSTAAAGAVEPSTVPPPPAAVTVVTRPQDTLWALSRRWQPSGGATRTQWMVAVRRGNPDAFVDGNLHRLRPGVTLALPTTEAVDAEDRAGADAVVRQHRTHLDAGRSGSALLPPTTGATAPGTAGDTGASPTVADPAPRAPPAPPVAAGPRPADESAPDAGPQATVGGSRGIGPAIGAALGIAAALAAAAFALARRRRRRSPAVGGAAPPAPRRPAADRGPLRRPAVTAGAALGWDAPATAAASDAVPEATLVALQLAIAEAQAEFGRLAQARRTAEAVARQDDTGASGAAARRLLDRLATPG